MAAATDVDLADDLDFDIDDFDDGALAALAVDGAIYAGSQLRGTFTLAPPRVTHDGFYQVSGHWSQMLPLVYQNRGDVLCDEEAPLTRAETIDYGPREQISFSDPSAVQSHRVTWGPNGFDVELASSKPVTLILNTNWNEHYKASVGTVQRWGNKFKNDRDGGRTAVVLPPMSGLVRVRYSPTSFWIGLAVSLLGWLAVLVYAFSRRAGVSASTS